MPATQPWDRVLIKFGAADDYAWGVWLKVPCITCRYSDLEKAEAIAVDMKKHLDKNEGVDKRLPCFVGLSGFDNFAVNIAVLVSCCSLLLVDQHSTLMCLMISVETCMLLFLLPACISWAASRCCRGMLAGTEGDLPGPSKGACREYHAVACQ